MTNKSEKHQQVAVIAALEDILSELDEKRLLLPALKIGEAMEILRSTVESDLSSGN